MPLKHPDFARVKKIVSQFNRCRILVVGDLILDEFIWGSVSRISPEAPVPVVLAESENFMPGGASNVANNLRALGADVTLVGVVGDDSRSEVLQGLLRKKGIHCDGIFSAKDRPTTQKTRVIAHHQQVVRIDREIAHPVPDALLDQLADFIKERLPQTDALIIEDYGKGVIVPRLVKQIVRQARKENKIITVDPKETHISYYRGVSAITPNHHEAAAAVGFKIKDDPSLIRAGQRLLEKLRCETVLITLGENGMAIFCHDRPMVKIPTIAQEVFDVSGAGDTVISVYTLAVASGARPIEAAHIANIGAGIVVGKVGVAVTNPEELLDRIAKETGAMMDAIGIIPARYGSTRFEGKVIKDLCGKPVIQHVYERAKKARLLGDLIIAADDERILKVVEGFGGKAVFTSKSHSTGTDRLTEVVNAMDVKIVVNIQGDEPLIHPLTIDDLVGAMQSDPTVSMATVVKRSRSAEEFKCPDVVKAILDQNHRALYFSRSPIPTLLNFADKEQFFYKHIGLYAYNKDFLFTFKKLPASFLETYERLEQLRALEHGYKIKAIETPYETVGIDTPEDLALAKQILEQERTSDG